MSEHFASGNWKVKSGRETEFIERWTEFLQWTRKTQPGLVSASLIRDSQDAAHFVSLAEWVDAGARDAWKSSNEFGGLFEACRALCADFYGGDYDRVVVI